MNTNIANIIIICPGSSFGRMTSCSPSYLNPLLRIQIRKKHANLSTNDKLFETHYYHPPRIQFWLNDFLLTFLFQPFDTNIHTCKQKQNTTTNIHSKYHYHHLPGI